MICRYLTLLAGRKLRGLPEIGKQHAQRINIRSGIRLGITVLFRRGKAFCAHNERVRRIRQIFPGRFKIDQHHPAIRPKNDIFRLDIPVDDRRNKLMEKKQLFAQLLSDMNDLQIGKTAFPAHPVERFPGYIFAYNTMPSVIPDVLHKSREYRRRQRFQSFRFIASIKRVLRFIAFCDTKFFVFPFSYQNGLGELSFRKQFQQLVPGDQLIRVFRLLRKIRNIQWI